MTIETDPSPEFAGYAHPERLVTTEWLAAHLGEPGLAVVESDEDVLLYETGHIPGSVKIDWHTDLNDPVIRDYVSSERFAELLGSKGIARDTTVVIYGDKNNWWAAYALWVFTLFGHEDVRLLDGGRDKWIAEGRELTRDAPSVVPAEYPVVERDDTVDPCVQGRRARPLRPAPDRRALAGGVQRRAHRDPRLPDRGRTARGAHPVGPVGAVGEGGGSGCDLQAACRTRAGLPRRRRLKPRIARPAATSGARRRTPPAARKRSR